MKRSLALTILIELIIVNSVVLCSGTLNQAKAQTTPMLYIDPASYTAQRIGETFNITVNIANLDASQRMIVAQFRVVYNDTLLQAVDVNEGPFLQLFNNTDMSPYTTFINFTENDLLWGPNVLVGILVNPSSTGQYSNFPYGNGTLATITFKTLYRTVAPSPPATCLLNLTDTLLVGVTPDNENVTEIPQMPQQSATYSAQPISMPTLSIQPSEYNATLLGEVFSINVNIDNLDPDSKMIVAQFRVQYNATLLEVIDATEGTFLQQFPNSEGSPYTYFIKYIEDNRYYGPNVLIGILLMPNSTGGWTNYPQGNGTLATITFETTAQPNASESPITSNLVLNDTLLVSNLNGVDVGEIPQTPPVNGLYQVSPLTFAYEPTEPLAGKVTMLNVTEPANFAPQTFSWDFGDGTMMNTTESSTGHIYAAAGNYNITLTVTGENLTSTTATQEITVLPSNEPAPLDVTVDVGSIHFKGETAQFSVLTASNGEAVDATGLKANLYYNGNFIADLSGSEQQASTGYYTVTYDVPTDAQPGTYTLVVQAEYYNALGTSLKSFQISPTLTAWNDQIAQITAIHDGIATVQNGLANLTLNLTAINATLAGLIQNNGQVLATINTSVGTLSTKLDTINATIININGNTATVSSTLGNITTKLDGIQSTATMTLYIASILSAIAVVLAAIILIFMRKK